MTSLFQNKRVNLNELVLYNQSLLNDAIKTP